MYQEPNIRDCGEQLASRIKGEYPSCTMYPVCTLTMSGV